MLPRTTRHQYMECKKTVAKLQMELTELRRMLNEDIDNGYEPYEDQMTRLWVISNKVSSVKDELNQEDMNLI